MMRLCLLFVVRENSAFALLLRQLGIERSHSLMELEKNLNAILEETQYQKWNYGLLQDSQFNEQIDSDWISGLWSTLEDTARDLLRNHVHPVLWSPGTRFDELAAYNRIEDKLQVTCNWLELFKSKASFTLDETAKICGQSRRTIQNRIKDGTLSRNKAKRIMQDSIRSYLGVTA